MYKILYIKITTKIILGRQIGASVVMLKVNTSIKCRLISFHTHTHTLPKEPKTWSPQVAGVSSRGQQYLKENAFRRRYRKQILLVDPL